MKTVYATKDMTNVKKLGSHSHPYWLPFPQYEGTICQKPQIKPRVRLEIIALLYFCCRAGKAKPLHPNSSINAAVMPTITPRPILLPISDSSPLPINAKVVRTKSGAVNIASIYQTGLAFCLSLEKSETKPSFPKAILVTITPLMLDPIPPRRAGNSIDAPPFTS